MKILIVVDMQKDFIDGSLGTKEAQGIVSNVVRKIENFDGTVIYTRDTHQDDYLDTQEGKKLPVVHCIKGTPGWEIHQDVFNAGADKKPGQGVRPIYDKPTFGCTELAEDIRHMYASNLKDDIEIELIGLCTDICVVSNALLLKAYMPAVKISVDSKCCAGVTKETHEAALKTMNMCQVNIIE